MSDSLRPHGLQLTRLLCPWNFSGKNIGVGCHVLLRGSSGSGDRTCISCVSCIGSRFFTTEPSGKRPRSNGLHGLAKFLTNNTSRLLPQVGLRLIQAAPDAVKCELGRAGEWFQAARQVCDTEDCNCYWKRRHGTFWE